MMKQKSETRDLIKGFCSYVERQFEKKIKTIRSDNGAEFMMTDYFKEKGIVHETSCIETPQQNGRVERKHQHILSVARALKMEANLPTSFWADCVLHAVYLINRIPSPLLSHKSPYSILFKSNPDLTPLKVFGCLCFASTNEANTG